MKRAAYGLVTLLALGACGVVCQRVAVRGRFVAPYSTYGAGPTGARGLFDLLTESGVSTRRWSEDFGALPAGGMMVALGGCEAGLARPLSRYEAEELDRWIGTGGTLLVAGARDYLPAGFGLGFEHDARCTQGWRLRDPESDDSSDESTETWVEPSADAGVVETVSSDAAAIEWVADAGASQTLSDAGNTAFDQGIDAAVAAEVDDSTDEDSVSWGEIGDDIAWTTPLSPPLRDLDLIPLKSPGVLQLDAYTNHQPLLGVGDAVHATVVPRGRGRVIWFASASPFQNGELHDSEGGVIFMRLLAAYAPKGPVSFDEYHLGVGEKRSLMSYLRGVGLLPVLLQLLAAVLILLWRGGARFGGVRREVETAPLGTASYVESMASLMERAKDPRGIVQILLRQGLRLVARKHRIVVEHGDAEATHLAVELRAAGQTQAAQQVERMMQSARRVDAQTKAHQLRTIAAEIDDAVRVANQLFDPLKPTK